MGKTAQSPHKNRLFMVTRLLYLPFLDQLASRAVAPFGRVGALPPGLEERVLRRARQLLRGAAALCLQDHDKGVLGPSLCPQLIALATAAGVPVLVDPAAILDFARYVGADCITPNRYEAALAVGDRQPPAEPGEQLDPSRAALALRLGL